MDKTIDSLEKAIYWYLELFHGYLERAASIQIKNEWIVSENRDSVLLQKLLLLREIGFETDVVEKKFKQKPLSLNRDDNDVLRSANFKFKFWINLSIAFKIPFSKVAYKVIKNRVIELAPLSNDLVELRNKIAHQHFPDIVCNDIDIPEPVDLSDISKKYDISNDLYSSDELYRTLLFGIYYIDVLIRDTLSNPSPNWDQTTI
jgi:hypothetical protein